MVLSTVNYLVDSLDHLLDEKLAVEKDIGKVEVMAYWLVHMMVSQKDGSLVEKMAV